MKIKDIVAELIRHRKEVQNDFGWNTTLLKSLDVAIEALSLIPDNATNGDVIKTLFPTISFNAILSKMYASCGQSLLDWWNAPYEAKSEDENR